MKKWIAFMLVFLLAFVLLGCDKTENGGGGGGKKEDEPKTVTISDNPASMDVGEEVQLTAKVNPEKAPQTVVWSSSDESIATVSETGLVKALAAGMVDIYATSTVNNKVQRKIIIQVIQPIVYEDPTSVEIEATQQEFRVNSFITLVAKVYPLADDATGSAGADQTVTWSSSNEEVATVNSAGRVNGVAVGDATITATVVADPSLTTTFDVTVVEGSGGQFDEKPTEIQVRGSNRVEEGYKIALVATVLPAGVSQNVTWTSENPDIATVNAQGVVTGIKAGTAYISVASNVDLTITRLFQVRVTPEVQLPERTNMNGYEIKIMGAGHALHEHDPKLDGYQSLDKTAKLAAWEEVETLFNATLKVVAFPDTAPWGNPRINWVIEKAGLNQSEMDIFVSTTDWLVQFANANATLDVSEYYEKYGRNSMSPAVVDASTYQNGLYALPTGGVGGILPYHGLFFNVNLLESKGLENPAQLFNEGEWTWSRFQTYIAEAAAILDEGESVLSGKPAGLFYGMVSAAGVSLIDAPNLQINFSHPHAVNAANLIRDLYVLENVWGDNAWDAENPSFNNEKSIFQVAEYWFLKTKNRFAEDMWGEGTTRYGYAPFPYPDSMQKSETRVSYQGGAIYQMPTGREYPSGITAEDVYRAFTEMMLGTTARMQADPEMNEDILMTRAAEFRLDDQESVTAITYFKSDKVIFDPYFEIIPSWQGAGPMIDAVVVNGQDYNQVVTERYPQYLAAMTEKFS